MLYLIADDSFNRNVTSFDSEDGCFVVRANNDEELTDAIASFVDSNYCDKYDYDNTLEDYDGSVWTVRELGEEFKIELNIERKVSGKRC